MQVNVCPTSVTFVITDAAIVDKYMKCADNNELTAQLTSSFEVMTRAHFTHEDGGEHRKESLKDYVTVPSIDHDIDHDIGDIGDIDADVSESSDPDIPAEMVDSLLDGLEDVLTTKAGFKITLAQGNVHQCVVLIQRSGVDDIRLEIKATCETIGTRDVDQFLDDLSRFNTSGIFWSMHSDIEDKPNFHVDCLANGRFALYLSNIGYNTTIIEEFVLLTHHLEAVACTQISPAALENMRSYLFEYFGKIEDVKSCVEQTLRMLDDINVNMDFIMSLINAGNSMSSGQLLSPEIS